MHDHDWSAGDGALEPELDDPPLADDPPEFDAPDLSPPLEQVHIDHLSVVNAEPDQGDGLVTLASDNHWLEPSSPLLALAGSAVVYTGYRFKRVQEPDAEDLARRVERGERVFVRIDADELASGDDRLGEVHAIPGQGATRQVELLGLERDAVLLSGPHGRRAVPVRSFETAWDKSGRLAYVADEPGSADR